MPARNVIIEMKELPIGNGRNKFMIRIVKCGRCGIREVASANGSLCAECKRVDKNRHHGRKNADGTVMVKFDTEGYSNAYGSQRLLTVSFGREDGTSGTLHTSDQREAIRWMIEQVQGEHDGKRQIAGAFHFNYDTAVLTQPGAFDPNRMMLIYKNRAGDYKTHAKDGSAKPLICNKGACAKCPDVRGGKNHCTDAGCGRCHIPFHVFNRKDIEYIIIEGGEEKVIAWDPESKLAISCTPRRRFYAEYRPNRAKYEGRKILDIHDHGTAFLGGLEDVIRSWRPDLTDSQREIIAWGKQIRKSNLSKEDPARVAAYSEAECIADARCTRKLVDTINSESGIGLDIGKLYGAGSMASAAYHYHGLTKHEDTAKDDDIDPIARLDYFGGLIETPVVGVVNADIRSEDLNSAYPSIMQHLPCMADGHGKWTTRTGAPSTAVLDKYTVGHVQVTWDLALHRSLKAKSTSTPPFSVRLKDGSVARPMASRVPVWVTMHEYKAARARYGPKCITAHHSHIWVPSCDCKPPFKWIAELYGQRMALKGRMAELKNNGQKGSFEYELLDVQQNGLKLLINSCYGKLAQQRPNVGTFTNMHYAAMITGATRAKVCQRTWEIEDQGGIVVYQHTDSVKFIEAPNGPDSKTLGEWGVEAIVNGLIILQPGLAAPLTEGQKGASRGAGKDEDGNPLFYRLAREWAGHHDFTRHPDNWAALVIKGKRMISAKSAAHRNDREKSGAFLDHELTIKPTDTKRALGRAVQISPGAWLVPPYYEIPADEYMDPSKFDVTMQRLSDNNSGSHRNDDITYDISNESGPFEDADNDTTSED